MLIYKRYIIKNILPSLVIIIFSMTTLVWITQILKFLYLIDKGIKIGYFFSLVILVLPSLLFILTPLATTISIIYTYLHLSEKRQIIILQNLGLNNFRLATPALLIAIIITLFSYYISASLLPLSYNKLKTDLNFMKNNYSSTLITEKIFNPISKDVTIYFDSKLDDNTMLGLIIFDNRKADNQAIIFAKSGNIKAYSNVSIFELDHGTRQTYDHNNNLTSLNFESLVIELTNKVDTSGVPNNRREINEYYIHELLNPDDTIDQQRKIKLIAEGHQRLIWPMYNFILVLASLSIFLRQPYNKKSHAKQILVTVSLVIIITYLHFTLQNHASKNLMYIFACYANVACAIILSIYLYSRKNI
ncbi:MAG: LptF/LptG family permease [Rickettsia endosymbiont of Bryobia graminum]|nr:LptF/LptG family permease [Rickettsia endosymbiont of Bryobia graminum]